jgi:hypothetical protein
VLLSITTSGDVPIAQPPPQQPTLYGITEIAEATGEDRRKVAVWYGRGKLPKEDFKPAAGPLWLPSTIQPWIEAHVKTKEGQEAHGT